MNNLVKEKELPDNKVAGDNKEVATLGYSGIPGLNEGFLVNGYNPGEVVLHGSQVFIIDSPLTELSGETVTMSGSSDLLLSAPRIEMATVGTSTGRIEFNTMENGKMYYLKGTPVSDGREVATLEDIPDVSGFIRNTPESVPGEIILQDCDRIEFAPRDELVLGGSRTVIGTDTVCFEKLRDSSFTPENITTLLAMTDDGHSYKITIEDLRGLLRL